MSYRDQFPDFPPSDMPAIPATWTDESWRNEPCPFFLASPFIGVYVDFADKSQREHEQGERFTVHEMDGAGGHLMTARTSVLFASDDWQAVLGFITARDAGHWHDTYASQPGAIDRLALAFRDVLAEWIGTVGMAKVRRENVALAGSGSCASHNYCDANMAMEEATRRTFGAGPLDGLDHMTDAATALWNAAWDKAKAEFLTDAA